MIVAIVILGIVFDFESGCFLNRNNNEHFNKWRLDKYTYNVILLVVRVDWLIHIDEHEIK